MAVYDGLGAPVQLGSNMQEHISGDLSLPGNPCHTGPWLSAANWGTTDATQAFGACAQPDWFEFPQSTVDMCVHQGELYVIWVELEDNGAGDHFVMGPYVKKWNGASWVAVGNAPVDNDVNLNQARFNADKFSAPTWLPAGHRTYPGMPKIASDGTDLYIAYTCMINAAAADPPANGNYWPCGDPYGVVVPANGAHNRWFARGVVVRQLNGSNWDLIDIIPATTNNSRYEPQGAQVNDISEIRLCASPAEPGVCYVAFAEWGIAGTCRYYVLNPVFFVGFVFGTVRYPNWSARLVVVRFESGVGIGQTLSSITGVSGTNPPGLIANPQALDIASRVNIDNQTGTCYIWWGREYTNGGGVGSEARRYMTRWDDLANLQTLSANPIGGAPSNSFVTFSMSAPSDVTLSDDSDAYVSEITGAAAATIPEGRIKEWEVQKDGLLAFAGLDGEPIAEIGPPTALFHLIAEDPDNIWALGASSYVWLYHRPCRAWSRLALAVPLDGSTTAFGLAAMVLLGSSLFVANYYYNAYNTAGHVGNTAQVRVLEIPILRNVNRCGDVLGIWSVPETIDNTEDT